MSSTETVWGGNKREVAHVAEITPGIGPDIEVQGFH